MSRMARHLLLGEPESDFWERRSVSHEAARQRRVLGACPTPAAAPTRRFRFSSPKPLDDRMVLTGVLFVSKTGSMWDDLPRRVGLRLRQDLPALLAAVGPSRHLAAAARRPPERTEWR
jgi:hypothetical protein